MKSFIGFIAVLGVGFLLGAFVNGSVGRNYAKEADGLRVKLDSINTVNSMPVRKITYQDLDQNNIWSLKDTSFTTMYKFHYGNHPGSLSWDSFRIEHKIKIVKLK